MSEPLHATEPGLKAHLTRVAQTMNALVDTSATVQVEADWSQSPLVAGLVGDGCEFVARNRGRGQVALAPFIELRQGLWAWVGYHEEWVDDPGGGRRRLSFRSSSVTVHFGRRNEVAKPQMFRAEWAGWAKWPGRESYGFQGGDAGHPHWQFDAIESLRDTEDARELDALRDLLSRAPEEVADFNPHQGRPDINEAVAGHELSRIHFASAAAWWRDAPNGAHAHCPTRTEDIRKWLEKCLTYVAGELRRLV